MEENCAVREEVRPVDGGLRVERPIAGRLVVLFLVYELTFPPPPYFFVPTEENVERGGGGLGRETGAFTFADCIDCMDSVDSVVYGLFEDIPFPRDDIKDFRFFGSCERTVSLICDESRELNSFSFSFLVKLLSSTFRDLCSA